MTAHQTRDSGRDGFLKRPAPRLAGARFWVGYPTAAGYGPGVPRIWRTCRGPGTTFKGFIYSGSPPADGGGMAHGSKIACRKCAPDLSAASQPPVIHASREPPSGQETRTFASVRRGHRRGRRAAARASHRAAAAGPWRPWKEPGTTPRSGSPRLHLRPGCSILNKRASRRRPEKTRVQQALEERGDSFSPSSPAGREDW